MGDAIYGRALLKSRPLVSTINRCACARVIYSWSTFQMWNSKSSLFSDMFSIIKTTNLFATSMLLNWSKSSYNKCKNRVRGSSIRYGNSWQYPEADHIKLFFLRFPIFAVKLEYLLHIGKNHLSLSRAG